MSDASYHLKMFFFWLNALIRSRDLHWLKKTVLEKAKHSFIGSCIKHYLKPVRFNNSQQKVLPFLLKDFLAELWRAKRACGAPWVSKSTHPRKFGNHVTVHRPPARPSAPQGNQCSISHFLASLGAQED